MFDYPAECADCRYDHSEFDVPASFVKVLSDSPNHVCVLFRCSKRGHLMDLTFPVSLADMERMSPVA